MAPAAPIAIPRSAIASAGASLTPSPTMITGRSVGSARDGADDLELVLGRLLGVDAVDAELAPTRSATERRSPEIIATWRMPSARSRSTIRSASGRSSSAITITPGDVAVDRDDDVGLAGPARAGQRGRGELVVGHAEVAHERAASDEHAVAVDRACDPLARAPRGRRSASSARARPRLAAVTSASPRTWADSRSTDAASRSSSPVAHPSAAYGCSRTSGVPTVSVPVLSNRTVRASPSVSIAPAPLTITPARAARERPDTSAIGAARISGHGVATTTTASAADRIAAQRPGQAGDQQRGRQEEAGVAVGHPHERRALASAPARPAAPAPRRRCRWPDGRRGRRTAAPRWPSR